MSAKQVIGGPLTIGGRELSLSRAIRAGDFVFVTGQVPLHDGNPMPVGACIQSRLQTRRRRGARYAAQIKQAGLI
jgi:enamine deaminase RidA (YjgF/YER057c/UK114 family)